MKSVRTDLALEARDLYNEQTKNENKDIDGVDITVTEDEACSVTHVKIITDSAAKNLGKPIGTYITITSDSIKTGDNFEELCEITARHISSLFPNEKKSFLTLVAGLGNWNVTPDSVGPKVVDSVLVTRHLYEQIPEHIDKRMRPLCAIAPGVLGLTGIETVEIINAVVKKVNPDVVIVIDALAARKAERVSTTIQISDTGIIPGSGVNNKRLAINKETLGVPVIAVGIPTVSDASTIAYDVIEATLMSISGAQQDSIKEQMVNAALSSHEPGFMVTPKDIDIIIKRASNIISGAINMAVHKGLTIEEISAYMS